MAILTIQRQTQTNKRYIEDLGDGISLEMVLISGGTFVMGSPKDELDNYDDEQPQHVVTVPTFFMGRYPVTQEQWRQIAKLSKVEIELNPDPSNFKGDKRPVERVTWHEAVEFCNRLKAKTGKKYQLPSEAQWEYACRGISNFQSRVTSYQLSEEQATKLIQDWNENHNQIFHWGKTITDELANYRATSVYGDGLAGKYREETTPVTELNNPNAFGLSDMHGHVCEWCLDPWHNNYNSAPIDGSVWIKGGNDNGHVARGGSWLDSPRNCRSACRSYYFPGDCDFNISFRVVCVP